MSKFKAGDLVRIRQWDDMKSQFGTDEDGDISLSRGFYFVQGMKHLCGMEFEIAAISHKDYGGLTDEVLSHAPELSEWVIIPQMLEYVEPEYEPDLDASDGFLREFGG